jgi:hypothetical protein
MVGFVDPHEVVVRKNAFLVLGNVQNDGVSEVRIEIFGHAWLKHSFSQVERYLDLQEILKMGPFPKKRATKKKVAIVTMKKEDEESEKVEKVGENWVDGEVLHLIALRRKMEFEFTKNAKKKINFNLLKP